MKTLKCKFCGKEAVALVGNKSRDIPPPVYVCEPCRIECTQDEAEVVSIPLRAKEER